MPAKKLKSTTQKPKVEAKRAEKATKKVSAEKINATVSASVKTQSKKSIKGLTVDVYDTKGKVTGSINLPKDIFGSKINEKLMAQSVRVYLANQRKGTVATKTRGEVQGSTRKIYRQKGTGRARHGAITAPIFVGGGIAFGPKPRDYSLAFPKKMRKAAFFSALSSKRNEGSIFVVSGLEKIAPKTKEMAMVFKKLPIEGKRDSTLLILSDVRNTENIQKAARNIEGVTVLPAMQLNTYTVLKSNALVFMDAAFDAMQKHFAKEV